ncbi:amidohydrolase family protein [Shewanella sedimentimangrovi]|uniref:Amidohydrolase family protein n=1 Tax=Shewanella sedimentimangrovi TaxID=2814293 RepID=A0ABX7R4B9_9GAMM|nr:amidohydrolase family protein [Shewanella sedimentimangrovi]QSX38329.1 amidohydrolase family protein [Shewanella sedimentimangrovi]
MRTLLSCLLLPLLALPAVAHDLIPATAQSRDLLLRHATLYTVSQGILEDTDLLLHDGRIAAIGKQLAAEGAEEIDASGKRIYPGLIALDSHAGMVEIEMARPTRDIADVGLNNAELRAASAFNPDSEIIPTLRRNGISHVQLVPEGEAMAGQSALVGLDSWTVEQALVPSRMGQHLYWPELGPLASDDEERSKQLKEHDEATRQIRTLFADAKRYALGIKAGDKIAQQRNLAAMAPLFDDAATLFIHVDREQHIEEALKLCREYQLKPVIVGGYDAWRQAASLNELGARVIYASVFSLPKRSDEPVDMAFRIPALLSDAGVPFAIGYSGDWDSRNLAFAAGYAAAHGLGQDKALRAITLDAARMLGVDDMGALEVGYRGNIIVAEGDILDPMSGRIEALFIDGRRVDLNNRQQQLYQKYLKK